MYLYLYLYIYILLLNLCISDTNVPVTRVLATFAGDGGELLLAAFLHCTDGGVLMPPVCSAVLKSPVWCRFAAWVIHGGATSCSLATSCPGNSIEEVSHVSAILPYGAMSQHCTHIYPVTLKISEGSVQHCILFLHQQKYWHCFAQDSCCKTKDIITHPSPSPLPVPEKAGRALHSCAQSWQGHLLS